MQCVCIVCVTVQCVCIVCYCVLIVIVSEIVPLLKTVMARMLPMLGLAKLDNMQWVFSNGQQL